MRLNICPLAFLCFLCYTSCSRENIKVKEVVAIAKGNAAEIEKLHFFNPDMTSPGKLILRRKYVLLGHWVQRWSKMIGARFEASDDEYFTPSEILHEVKELPIGVENIELHVSKPYRYVRMKMRPDARPDYLLKYGGNILGQIAQWVTGGVKDKTWRDIYLHGIKNDYSWDSLFDKADEQ